MKDKDVKLTYKNYIQSLTYLSEGQINRINYFYNHYQKLILRSTHNLEGIKDIFISNIINEDKKNIYENLWFFTMSYSCEITKFDLEDNYDIAFTKENIMRISIKKENYNPEDDINKISKDSRLYIEANLENNFSMIFQASDTNCSYLYRILLRNLLPNLIKT